MARGTPIDFDTVAAAARPPVIDNDDPPEVPEAAAREPARVSARVAARRYEQPEPHLRYQLDPEEIPAGMVAQWVATKVKGAPTGTASAFYRAGWEPAEAKDFPRLSGYGTDFPQNLIDRGLIQNVKPDDLVTNDDASLVLMLCPKENVQKAAQKRKRDADDLVHTQFDRLQVESRRRVGARTEVRRGYANPDVTPDTANAQEI